MSRRDEVEAEIKNAYEYMAYPAGVAFELARTLADEVDDRDRIITELLAMLKDNKPGRIHGVTYYTDAQNKQAELYARACGIAGRAE